MTYTFKRKLMYTNKSPRRIDRRAGARNKKIILKSYQTITKNKKNQFWLKYMINACDATHVYLILDCFLKLKKTLSVWTIGSKEIQETK